MTDQGIPARAREYPHWTCKEHGDFDARVAVGCPECVRLMRGQLRAANEPRALCTDCLSIEARDGRIVHREGCSIAPQFDHGGRIMTLAECAEAEGARVEPKMDDETVALRRLLGAAQARIVELEGSYEHHITCNYTSGPIGGDGCICVVLNKHEQALLAKIAHEGASQPPGLEPTGLALELIRTGYTVEQYAAAIEAVQHGPSPTKGEG